MNQDPEAGGAVKPASSDAPDAKQTARIAAQAAKLARKPVADEWDKVRTQKRGGGREVVSLDVAAAGSDEAQLALAPTQQAAIAIVRFIMIAPRTGVVIQCFMLSNAAGMASRRQITTVIMPLGGRRPSACGAWASALPAAAGGG